MNSSFRTMKRIGTATKRDVGMATWVRITSLTFTIMLAASVSLGLPLHPSDNGCNPAEMQADGCERMGIEPSAPGVAGTALCCLLDCLEPASTGSALNLRIPTFNVASVYRIVLPPPVTVRQLPQQQWLQSSSFTPPNSYLKNLSLLI